MVISAPEDGRDDTYVRLDLFQRLSLEHQLVCRDASGILAHVVSASWFFVPRWLLTC